MKKRSLICLCLCALLCSCQAQIPDKPQTETEQPQTQEPNTTDAERIAYYEQLVNELQKEILSLRTEIYVGRVEYEALLEDLLAATPPQLPNAPDLEDGQSQTEPQFFYTVKDGKATVTSYVGKATAVTVPSVIDGYAVVAVGDRAFMNRTDVVSVVLPKGVQTLGWFAFSGCIALTRVELPDSVEMISYGAFDNCPSALTIHCSPNSYAAEYANSYGIARQATTAGSACTQ